jgi:hypothetical protein
MSTRVSGWGMRMRFAFGLTTVSVAHAAAPPSPPTVAQIEACVEQMDVGHAWQFIWKKVEVGTARHPRNPLEALAFGGVGVPDNYGYPVRVAYSLNGLADFDTTYWIIRNAGGQWEIAALCVLPANRRARTRND